RGAAGRGERPGHEGLPAIGPVGTAPAAGRARRGGPRRARRGPERPPPGTVPPDAARSPTGQARTEPALRPAEPAPAAPRTVDVSGTGRPPATTASAGSGS